MRLRSLLLLPLLLVLPGSGAAQDSMSSSAEAQSRESSGVVQIGAGSTASVTTGASGAEQSPNPSLPGGVAPFQIKPRDRPFLGPEMLPIQQPDQLRCPMIADQNARRRCEAEAAKRGVATRG